MYIGNFKIGPRLPTYCVAEISANHNQSLERAKELVHAAKEAGADAVKLQTYTADTLTIRSDRAEFQIQGGLWSGRQLHELYQEAYTPWEWQPQLAEEARRLGLELFSTPFDLTALEFLERELDPPAHKIASFEIVDLPLLRAVAGTGKPIILSTGMASLGEIDEAVQTLRDAGCRDLVLLKCNSGYPADPAEMNLRTIPHLAEAFGVPVGLSDHTLGHEAAIASVALGGCVIEKHFTLARADGGPDAAFSLEPHEFRQMVESVRVTEAALGRVRYTVTKRETISRVFRRSLFVVKPISAGEPLTPENVRSIRPGHGMAPRYYDMVLGFRASVDIKPGTPLTWDLIR